MENIIKEETAFFTGPRAKKLVGYDHKGYAELTDRLTERIYELATRKNKPIKNFISGGAQGFDQLAFWAVDIVKRKHPNLGIRNVLLLPYLNQQNLWMVNGPFGQIEYLTMLKETDIIAYTYQNIISTKQQATQYLMQRNTDMLNASGTCIGLWTDDDLWKQPTTKGGTADALRKASAAGLEMQFIRYRIEGTVVKPL